MRALALLLLAACGADVVDGPEMVNPPAYCIEDGSVTWLEPHYNSRFAPGEVFGAPTCCSGVAIALHSETYECLGGEQ